MCTIVANSSYLSSPRFCGWYFPAEMCLCCLWALGSSYVKITDETVLRALGIRCSVLHAVRIRLPLRMTRWFDTSTAWYGVGTSKTLVAVELPNDSYHV